MRLKDFAENEHNKKISLLFLYVNNNFLSLFSNYLLPEVFHFQVPAASKGETIKVGYLLLLDICIFKVLDFLILLF